MNNPHLRNYLNYPVEDLEVETRTRGIIADAYIQTIGRLCMKTRSDMLKYRNCGPKTCEEIEKALDLMGLRLGMTREELELKGFVEVSSPVVIESLDYRLLTALRCLSDHHADRIREWGPSTEEAKQRMTEHIQEFEKMIESKNPETALSCLACLVVVMMKRIEILE